MVHSQCRHSLCNVHLLRDLVFIEEVAPEQKVWTAPLSKLLLKIKDTVAEARAGPDARLSDEAEQNFLRRYNRLVKRAAKLTPQPDSARLCFMRDISVPFDNNGSERDLRMVKLKQKISGCFRTDVGARSFCRVRSYLSTTRKHDYTLLCALERALSGKPLPFQSTEPASTT